MLHILYTLNLHNRLDPGPTHVQHRINTDVITSYPFKVLTWALNQDHVLCFQVMLLHLSDVPYNDPLE